MRIINSDSELTAHFETLDARDIIIGRVRLRHGEEHLLLDLVQRGVKMMPSALAQILSRSKAAQAKILGSFMLPYTLPVYDRNDMMDAVSLYNKNNINRIVVKLDRANAGQGILLFGSVEEVNSQAALGNMHFPFVLQPFQENCIDVRVVMLGEQSDCYRRHNPHNFRHNLHCGGASSPFQLTREQQELCRAIMQRGVFPYAHIDLLITSDHQTFLSEINLRGGLRGSRMNQKVYLQQIRGIHQAFLDHQLRLT